MSLEKQLKELIKLTDDFSEDSSDFSKFDTISERLTKIQELLGVRVDRIQKIFDDLIVHCDDMIERIKKKLKKLDNPKKIVLEAFELDTYVFLRDVLVEKKKEVLAELTEKPFCEKALPKNEAKK